MYAQSETRRVIGPTWSQLQLRSSTPARETRPYVGFSPAMPHIDAGMRMLPPVSVPIAPTTQPAATAAPEPLEEPPVHRSRSQGFRGCPVYGFSPWLPWRA